MRRTRAGIEIEVTMLTEQIQRANPALTMAEAEAEVWTTHPNLYSAWHELPPERPVETSPNAPAQFAETAAADRIWRELEDKAVALMGKNTLMTREQALAEVLTSAEGRRLYAAYDEAQRKARRS